MASTQGKGDTSSSQPTIAPDASRTNLLSIPPELTLAIFHEVNLSSTSSQDVISLATSSKQLYALFKQNEYLILRHIITSLLPPSPFISNPSTLADTVIKLAIAHSRKPWPTSPDAITTSLLCAGDPAVPVSVSSSMYGTILQYVRSTIDGCRRRPEGAREKLWRVLRVHFAMLCWIAPPAPLVARHPFERFDPTGLPRGWKGDMEASYENMVAWVMEGYAEHARVPVSDRERTARAWVGYVPCCLLEHCPRAW